MKLQYAHLTNFKGIKDFRLDFQTAPGQPPANLHAVIGDNGSGKTSILQAIAMVLSLATGKTRALEDFQ